ncbi:MAG: NAD(P)-binding domain-containing protein [Acidimicrobiia bacterium]
MKVAVLGAGAVGSRTVRQLASSPEVSAVAVADLDPARARTTEAAIDEDRVRAVAVAGWADGADVAVLCKPGAHAGLVTALLEAGSHVVSVSDELDDVDELLALDGAARAADRSVVVGAGFSPGLTCLLAAHGAATLDEVEEIHVAKVGTAGPACARAHHRALAGESVDWRDGSWRHRRAGSGRELCWFPDPVGGQDCYRASAPDARLLVPAFPGVLRVTARVQATRRDRLTARLPMLRRPHPEGSIGAARVELRGRRGTSHEVVVLGAMDRPGVAAGAVAALAAVWAGEGRLRRTGSAGLAVLVDPLPMLAELARRGVKAAVFEGRQPA